MNKLTTTLILLTATLVITAMMSLTIIAVNATIVDTIVTTQLPLSEQIEPEKPAEEIIEGILEEAKYKNRTFQEWDEGIKYRGIDAFYPEALDNLYDMYVGKINRAQAELDRLTCGKYNVSYGEVAEDISSLETELDRLNDKFISTYKEKEFRDKKMVAREMHHTVYYLDLDSGNDSHAGTTPSTAWLTLAKYTTTTARSAGDIAYVRAGTNQTMPASDIQFDEDGTSAAYIEIRGCSSTMDPWGDADDTKPIFDLNAGAYELYPYGDDYWRFYRLELKNGTSGSGLLYMRACHGMVVEDCDFHGASTFGIDQSSFMTHIKGCTFYDNGSAGIRGVGWGSVVENCTFNGGVSGSNYGVYINSDQSKFINCTFGVTTAHNVASIHHNYTNVSTAHLINCNLADATEVYDWRLGGRLYSEDHDQVFNAHKLITYQGIVERDTAVVRSGGANSSAKMQPNTYCNANYPLTISEKNGVIGNTTVSSNDFLIWCVGGIEKTVTIYARETVAWAADPSADEFYIQANYLSNAASAVRADSIASTQTLSGTTWVGFTTTFTPARTGFAYISVYLKKYESGKYISVDIKPVVS